MSVLIACEESQVVCAAFRALGMEAYSCDLLHPSGGHHEWHYCGDVIPLLKQKWDAIIAFPPCTHLASSGARWFAEKRADGRQQAGIDFFMQFVNVDCPFVAIENPVGIMSSIWRKPDQIIQPWQFGHPETKATCLWLRRLPILEPTNIVKPDYMRRSDGSYYTDSKGKRYSRIHFMSGRQPDRAVLRSKTYTGVADAMAAQWSPVIKGYVEMSKESWWKGTALPCFSVYIRPIAGNCTLDTGYRTIFIISSSSHKLKVYDIAQEMHIVPKEAIKLITCLNYTGYRIDEEGCLSLNKNGNWTTYCAWEPGAKMDSKIPAKPKKCAKFIADIDM